METLKHYRIGELAKIIGVSQVTIRTWIKCGYLKGRKNPSGQFWVLEEDLKLFIEKISNDESAAIYTKPWGTYNTKCQEKT
jgi:predicted site-specific integrase-resolvase